MFRFVYRSFFIPDVVDDMHDVVHKCFLLLSVVGIFFSGKFVYL